MIACCWFKPLENYYQYSLIRTGFRNQEAGCRWELVRYLKSCNLAHSYFIWSKEFRTIEVRAYSWLDPPYAGGFGWTIASFFYKTEMIIPVLTPSVVVDTWKYLGVFLFVIITGSCLPVGPEESRNASCPAVWGTVTQDEELSCLNPETPSWETLRGPLWESRARRGGNVLQQQKIASYFPTCLINFSFSQRACWDMTYSSNLFINI